MVIWVKAHFPISSTLRCRLRLEAWFTVQCSQCSSWTPQFSWQIRRVSQSSDCFVQHCLMDFRVNGRRYFRVCIRCLFTPILNVISYHINSFQNADYRANNDKSWRTRSLLSNPNPTKYYPVTVAVNPFQFQRQLLWFGLHGVTDITIVRDGLFRTAVRNMSTKFTKDNDGFLSDFVMFDFRARTFWLWSCNLLSQRRSSFDESLVIFWFRYDALLIRVPDRFGWDE
jgi:hypothetical protein